MRRISPLEQLEELSSEITNGYKWPRTTKPSERCKMKRSFSRSIMVSGYSCVAGSSQQIQPRPSTGTNGMNQLEELQKALMNSTSCLKGAVETLAVFLRGTSVFPPSFISLRCDVYAFCFPNVTQRKRTTRYSVSRAGASPIFVEDVELTLFLGIASSSGL